MFHKERLNAERRGRLTDDKTKKTEDLELSERTEDLELSESKAGKVMGGQTMPIRARHTPKKGTSSSPKPLHGSMPHE
jgi:hypothetical protein